MKYHALFSRANYFFRMFSAAVMVGIFRAKKHLYFWQTHFEESFVVKTAIYKLCMRGKKFNRQHFDIVYLFFVENRF